MRNLINANFHVLFSICSTSWPLDRLIRSPDDAMWRWSVPLPKLLWKLRPVRLLDVLRSPLVKRWQRHPLRLCRAVWTSTRLRQVLLVVVFCVVEDICVSPLRRVLDLGGDGTHALARSFECCFICSRAGLKDFFLIFIKIVQTASVLSSAVISLSHSLRWIVGFPEPPENVDNADLRWIKNYLNRLCVPCLTTASLPVGGIWTEATCITHSR
mmetsp:Transcript_43911/g.77130  ORF Transcript_43911/g.77130 Transcript_43911/m.77130 type:complete len:213 (+) Transcript_43911:3-641(+)